MARIFLFLLLFPESANNIFIVENNCVVPIYTDFLSSSEGLQLNRAFVKIEDPKVRKKLVELAKALANISED